MMRVTAIGVVGPVAGRVGSSSSSMYAEVGDVARVSGSWGCELSKLECNPNVSQLDGLDRTMGLAPELAEGLKGNVGVL